MLRYRNLLEKIGKSKVVVRCIVHDSDEKTEIDSKQKIQQIRDSSAGLQKARNTKFVACIALSDNHPASITNLTEERNSVSHGCRLHFINKFLKTNFICNVPQIFWHRRDLRYHIRYIFWRKFPYENKFCILNQRLQDHLVFLNEQYNVLICMIGPYPRI